VLRDPNNTLLVQYAGGVMSVSEDSGGALIREKRCACGIPPALWTWTWERLASLFRQKNLRVAR
jgi:hypothetical protein